MLQQLSYANWLEGASWRVQVELTLSLIFQWKNTWNFCIFRSCCLSPQDFNSTSSNDSACLSSASSSKTSSMTERPAATRCLWVPYTAVTIVLLGLWLVKWVAAAAAPSPAPSFPSLHFCRLRNFGFFFFCFCRLKVKRNKSTTEQLHRIQTSVPAMMSTFFNAPLRVKVRQPSQLSKGGWSKFLFFFALQQCSFPT